MTAVYLLLIATVTVMATMLAWALRVTWLYRTGRRPLPTLPAPERKEPPREQRCQCLTPMSADGGEVWVCPHGNRWRAYGEDLEGYLFLRWAYLGPARP